MEVDLFVYLVCLNFGEGVVGLVMIHRFALTYPLHVYSVEILSLVVWR